jgi:hypothetical protein
MRIDHHYYHHHHHPYAGSFSLANEVLFERSHATAHAHASSARDVQIAAAAVPPPGQLR